jgi:hypothetical protein
LPEDGKVSKPSQVILVVEDDNHRMLLYRYLKRCGLERVTRIPPSPSGRGSAEQWVRKQFIEEVVAYRRRQAKAQTALIIVIDADTHTVRHRLNQLDQALREAQKDAVAANERIARLAPRRNIETWILCLNDEAVNEETDYKNDRRGWNRLISPAAEELYTWTRPPASQPEHFIDSLRAGIAELKRLEF